jgi:hypothetical protein
LKKERSKKHRRLQLLRVAVQAFFLGLFFFLLFGTHYTGLDYIGRVEVFFHFDPLLAVTTFLASRAVLAFLRMGLPARHGLPVFFLGF